jgi:rRNA maturation protein Rpf1
MRSLCHDLEHVLPNATHINRGKLSLAGVFNRVFDVGAENLILVERWKGGPGRIHFYQITPEVTRLSLLLILGGVKTQIDFGRRRRLAKKMVVTVTEDPPKNILKLAQFLAHFLTAPLSTKGIEETATTALHISPIPDGEASIQVHALPGGSEVGPRLIVKQAVWETPR